MITHGQGLILYVTDNNHFVISTLPCFRGMKQGWEFENIKELEDKIEELKACLVHQKILSGIVNNK